MSEDNKIAVNETVEEKEEKIDLTNVDEPIDSIEKTVEDLKRKIQELSEEKAEKEIDEPEIPAFIKPEQKDNTESFIEKTKDTVTSSISELKEKAEQSKNSEELQKAVTFIKDNAVKAVSAAKVKIDEVKSNPKVAEYADKTVDAIKSAGAMTNEKVHSAGKYVDEHMDPKAKEALINTGKVINDGARKVVTGVNDYVNRPDVQEKFEKARVSAADAADKGKESLKKFFKRDSEE